MIFRCGRIIASDIPCNKRSHCQSLGAAWSVQLFCKISSSHYLALIIVNWEEICKQSIKETGLNSINSNVLRLDPCFVTNLKCWNFSTLNPAKLECDIRVRSYLILMLLDNRVKDYRADNIIEFSRQNQISTLLLQIKETRWLDLQVVGHDQEDDESDS